MNDNLIRCSWCNIRNPIYVAYHDNEWGRLPDSAGCLYELFILETFQAGLSWECVLNKREGFRKAFDGFDIEKVCSYKEDKISSLMSDSGIIRSMAKIRAAVENSIIYRSIEDEYSSFMSYLMSFTGGKRVSIPDLSVTRNALSDEISSDLKRRGMSFVGSVTIFSFLEASGIITSRHVKECFLHDADC